MKIQHLLFGILVITGLCATSLWSEETLVLKMEELTAVKGKYVGAFMFRDFQKKVLTSAMAQGDMRARAPIDIEGLERVGDKPGGFFVGGAYLDAAGNKWLVKDFTTNDKDITQADVERFIVNNIVASRILNHVFPGEYPETALIQGSKKMVAVRWVDGFVSQERDVDHQCEDNRASNAQLVMVRTLLGWENNSRGNVGCLIRGDEHIPFRLDYDDAFWPGWTISLEDGCFGDLERYNVDELRALIRRIIGNEATEAQCVVRLAEFEEIVDDALVDVSTHFEFSEAQTKIHKLRIMHVLYENLARMLWFDHWMTNNFVFMDHWNECNAYWKKRSTLY